MMDFAQIAWLAVLQGLTEFLPISSSAHLILVPPIVGWQDQGLAFDVAVHVGTLSAVIFYFRREIGCMFVDWSLSCAGKGLTNDAVIAWGVLVGTIPAGIVGLLFKDYIEIYFRSPTIIAVTTIAFGILLWLSERLGKKAYSETKMGMKEFFVIGCFQAVALIPGTSRSGITMTAGLLLGYTREAAARVSFLLSIPIITLSGALVTKDLIESPLRVDWVALGLGSVISCVCAFLCIHYFLKFISTIGMLPFLIYRIVLGVFLFVFFASP